MVVQGYKKKKKKQKEAYLVIQLMKKPVKKKKTHCKPEVSFIKSRMAQG